MVLAQEQHQCLCRSGRHRVDHPRGHYELWTELAGKGKSWLKTQGFPTLIASSEYEAHPRGRVVYDTASKGFVVYLDPRISAPQFRTCLKVAFGLGGQKIIVRRDAHPPRSLYR